MPRGYPNPPVNPFNPAQAGGLGSVKDLAILRDKANESLLVPLPEILEEDEPFDETLAKVAADIEAEEETEELLAVDERPLFRFLRDPEQHIDKSLNTAAKEGYTHVEALDHTGSFFYIIMRRD
jgi:hypothetical protein